MGLKVCSLSRGSSGYCYVHRYRQTNVLVDGNAGKIYNKGS